MKHFHILRLILKYLATFLLTMPLHSQTVHHLNVWGGGAYTSLLHGIDNTKVPGGFGFEAGLGYQMDVGRFMLNIGAEYQHINSWTKLEGYAQQYTFQYTGVGISAGDNHYITYHYDFLTYEEKHSMGYLNIPIEVGIRFNRYYALAGAKIGFNLFGNYKIENANIFISADDPRLIDPMENIGNGTGSFVFQSSGQMDVGLSIAPSIEFGVYLNEWLPQRMIRLNNAPRNTPVTYRAGVFLDYGVVNINKSKTDKPMVSEPSIHNPSEITLNPLIESNLANGKRFSNMVVGIKLTVQFQMTAKRKPKPIPPTPPFYVRVIDEETHEPLNAEVILSMTAGRKQEIFRQMTDDEGIVSLEELKAGRYMLNAASEGYNSYRKSISHRNADTLLVPMKLTPVFYVHVYDTDTRQNLKAEVTITLPNAAVGSKPILKTETNEKTGLLESNIRTGRYQMNVTKEGYIYHQEIVNYSKTDTIRIALQPIKKNVVVVMHNLYFALNEAVILSESEQGLNELYQFLANNPSVNIKITGHTDNTGSLAYNIRLSEARAKAVHDELVERGVDPARIIYEGKGPNQPIATNETDEGRALNRRVEFVIQ